MLIVKYTAITTCNRRIHSLAKAVTRVPESGLLTLIFSALRQEKLHLLEAFLVSIHLQNWGQEPSNIFHDFSYFLFKLR